MNRRLQAAILAAVFAASPLAQSWGASTIQLKDANGTPQPFLYFQDGGGNNYGATNVYGWAGGVLGAMSNYGTSPGAVLVPGVNSWITGGSLGLTGSLPPFASTPTFNCGTGCGGGGGSATPFIPGPTPIAPFTATGTSTTTSIPTGATTLIVSSAASTNNFLHCTLGAGPATTSDQTIVPGASFPFNVTSATQFSCVTSSGSQVVTAVAGSGGASATGGSGQTNVNAWGGTAITNIPTAVGTAGTGNTPTFNAEIVGPAATALGTSALATDAHLTALGTSALATDAHLTALTTALGTPMQASGGSVTANAGTNLNTSLLATDAHLTALGTGALATDAHLTALGTGALATDAHLTSFTSANHTDLASVISNTGSATPPTPYAGSGAATAIAELDAIRQGVAAGSGTPGSAAPSQGVMVGGSDGTNFQPEKITAAGTSASSAQAMQGVTGGVALPTIGISQYPLTAVPLTASATGTTAATTATLTNVTGHTTFICGYSIRANATAATTVLDTVTGVITATMSSELWVAPAASGLGVDEQIFTPCIPASAASTSIAVVSGAPGAGGLVSVKAWGYSL